MCVAALAAAPGLMQGLQIASAVGGLIAQQQKASAIEAANQRQYQAAVSARNANAAQSYLQANQEREATIQKLEENNAKARAAQATAAVSAGESGVTGLSVDALLADLEGKGGRYNSSVMTNYDRALMAINRDIENNDNKAASVINGLKSPDAPDFIGTGLKIANIVKQA